MGPHPMLAAVATVAGKAVVVEVTAPLRLVALVDPALQRAASTLPVASPVAVVSQAAASKVADQVGPVRARARARCGPAGAESLGKAWPGTKAKVTPKALAKAKAQAAMPGMHISRTGARALAALGTLMEPLDGPRAAGSMSAPQFVNSRRHKHH